MIIIAHRGSSGELPENTLPAINLAIQQNVDGIEIDVFSMENTPIVSHNINLPYKNSTKMCNIEQEKLENLSQINAAKGGDVPLLLEVLELINNRCFLNIEIKSKQPPHYLLNTLKKAQDLQMIKPDFILLSSFHHDILEQIKKIAPEYAIALLVEKFSEESFTLAQKLNAFAYNMEFSHIEKAHSDKIHKKKLKLFAYTVNKESDVIKMIENNVDGIFTDYPHHLKQFVENNQHNPNNK